MGVRINSERWEGAISEPQKRRREPKSPNPSLQPRSRAEVSVGKRILVVDDEIGIQEIIETILLDMGFEVTVASNGDEGLKLFLGDSFDLVLTDLEMPGMDGWSFAAHIKNESPDTTVVLLTGEEKGAVIENLKGSCVDFAIFKPFRLEDIQDAVLRIP